MSTTICLVSVLTNSAHNDVVHGFLILSAPRSFLILGWAIFLHQLISDADLFLEFYTIFIHSLLSYDMNP